MMETNEQQQKQVSSSEEISVSGNSFDGSFPPVINLGGNQAAAASEVAPVVPEQQVILYDADANQRIPFSTEENGVLYEVAFILGPQTDSAIGEYDRRCDRRFSSADERDTGERNTLQQTDNSFEAALWLFNNRLLDVDGFGDPKEKKPQDWQELIGSDADKAAVIDQAYLACDIAPLPPAKPGQRRGWSKQLSTIIRLRALFEGFELILSHERAEPITADQMADFKSIMKQRWLVGGSRTGQAETRIPPKAKRLGALYDQIGYRATGYTGRVPLHHKTLVVITDFSKEADVVRKN